MYSLLAWFTANCWRRWVSRYFENIKQRNKRLPQYVLRSITQQHTENGTHFYPTRIVTFADPNPAAEAVSVTEPLPPVPRTIANASPLNALLCREGNAV
jgi:hypothetical protein